jgi:hypothetical protein
MNTILIKRKDKQKQFINHDIKVDTSSAIAPICRLCEALTAPASHKAVFSAAINIATS